MRKTTTQRRPIHGVGLANASTTISSDSMEEMRERSDYNYRRDTARPDDDGVKVDNNNAIAIHNRKCPHHSFIVCDVVTIDGTLDILMHTLDR